MSVKKDRLNVLIQRELSLIFQNDIRDKNLGFVTITGVQVTNDLSYCDIYVSFLGKNYDTRKGMETLEKSKGFIRSLLARKLTIRKIPELKFKIDSSIEYGNKIESLIREIHSKDNEKQKD